MLFKIISILVSLTAGILFIRYFRKKDKYEPEPFKYLFAVIFIGGILSISISLALYLAIKVSHVNFLVYFNEMYHMHLYFLFVVGPVEELSKLTAFLIIYPFIKKQFNETTDGLIYISCIALGFSLIENYFYANSAKGNEILIFTRLLVSTPGHISFSIFMGFGVYNFFRQKKKYALLIKPFILSAVIHGLFNISLLYTWGGLAILTYLRLSLKISNHLINYTNSVSEFRPTLKSFIKNYVLPKKEKRFNCIKCGSTLPKLTYVGENFIIQKCNKCNTYITDLSSAFNLFRYFANTEVPPGAYCQRDNKFSPHTGEYLWTVMKKNYFSPKLKVGYFNLKSLSNYLEFTNGLKAGFRNSSFIKLIAE